MISLKIIAGILLMILLTLVAILHFYWAAGGKRFSEGVIPELEKIELFQPGPIPTAIVGFGLLMMAAIVAANLNWLDAGEWHVWIRRGLWAITIIFLVRAIGEFNYIGLFKRKKNSLFAEKDSKYYSPLCLGMSLLGFLVLFC